MSSSKGIQRKPKKVSASFANLTLDLDFRPSFDHIANTLPELVGAALAICAKDISFSLDAIEEAVAKECRVRHDVDLETLTLQVAKGDDVLGREYCRIKSAEDRRKQGATFTPETIIDSMLDWSRVNIDPALIIDPGAGTARYAIAAALRFPNAKVVAIEIDPILRIIAKARIQAMGLGHQISVESCSFLDYKKPDVKGPVLYIGNPPYVRHHDINPSNKVAYAARCKKLGIGSSGLAGLHLHFMIKVFEMAAPGDSMAFITAAEWMDTNYGNSLRQLLASGQHHVFIGAFSKNELVFKDALSSAVISCVNFYKSSTDIQFDTLSCDPQPELGNGKKIEITTAQHASSWNGRMQNVSVKPVGDKTLGDLFRISRGMVTGMNDVWVVSTNTPKLPERFLHHCITNSEDITSLTDKRLVNKELLRKIVNLPENLSAATNDELAAIEHFLQWAKEKGADATFTAKHRKCWWRIDIKEPPPIVMTYMGRRPPVFARNIAKAPLLNIAHGLYPKVALTDQEQDALVAWLNENVSVDSGRSYAGGLVKFEPKEAMQIAIPDIKQIMKMHS
jgi:adenine-specific DNA-methyltransferase